MKKFVASIIFLAASSPVITPTACAVELRVATASEYVGVWRLINIPDAKIGTPGANDKSPFRGPCQFFIVDGSGDWWHMHVETASGDADTKKDCPQTLSDVKKCLQFLPVGPRKLLRISGRLLIRPSGYLH
jgi:hypothetical protein